MRKEWVPGLDLQSGSRAEFPMAGLPGLFTGFSDVLFLCKKWKDAPQEQVKIGETLDEKENRIFW